MGVVGGGGRDIRAGGRTSHLSRKCGGGQQVKGKGHTNEWRGICYDKKTKKTLGV